MSRSLRLAAVAAALVLLIGTGCKKKNSAPEAPGIQGSASARPADTLSYRFNTTDPDGDSVFFTVSWGDGDSTQWSPAVASGEDYTQTHVYSDSGTYYITAKAKDSKDAESALSDSFRVKIGSFAPAAPVLPTGPKRCSTGIAYTWSTKALHPLHDSVSIQFSWGNGVDSFGRMVASNAVFAAQRTYSLPGTYKIAARARDAKGYLSPWSDTLTVTVDTATGTQHGAPTGVRLNAATDSTVNVAWFAPADSTPSGYVVLFKETGTANFDSVGSTVSLSYVHDPAHRTGQYAVAAVYGSNRVQSATAPSTAPVHSTSLAVPELSDTAANTGYGWNRSTGDASLYDMKTLDSAALVDFYVTDSAPGFAGPNYKVASPEMAPQDPGGSVPIGSWHITWFSHLDSTATADSILPRFAQSRYRRSSLLDSLPRLVACVTEDTCYALLNVDAVDTVSGTADIETWFQLIRGLRLIEH